MFCFLFVLFQIGIDYFIKRYESDGLNYTHYGNSKYSFDCRICHFDFMYGQTVDLAEEYDLANTKMSLYTHFRHKTRSKAHERKVSNSNWLSDDIKSQKAFTKHFTLLQEQIDLGLGDNTWDKRIYTLYKQGVDVGQKDLSKKNLRDKKEVLYEVV